MSETAVDSGPEIIDVSREFGDGRETIVLFPMMYREFGFRIQVNTGWWDDDDLMRDQLDALQEAIEEECDTYELYLKHYASPDYPGTEYDEWGGLWEGCFWRKPWQQKYPDPRKPDDPNQAQ